jgi:hypothetical protein
MAAIMYDAQVERFETLLVEGRLYYAQMMVVKPIMSNHYYKLGRSLQLIQLLLFVLDGMNFICLLQINAVSSDQKRV